MSIDGGRLVAIDRANWRAAAEVRVLDEQEAMVTEHQPAALVLLAKAYVSDGGEYWEPLAFEEPDGSISCVFGLVHRGAVVIVRNFAVDASVQGQGVGRRVMRALIQRCSAAGLAAIELTTHPDNTRARRLYEGAGLVQTGEFRDSQPVFRLDLSREVPG